MKFAVSNVCHAFDAVGIGSRVVAPKFYEYLEKATNSATFSDAGIARVVMPPESLTTVSCGVGYRTKDPSNYVLRLHRGQVGAYLKREFAKPATSLAVIVYKKAAYLVDKDVLQEPDELKRVKSMDVDYVIVSVNASCGDEASRDVVDPFRFVCNVSGSNLDYDAYNKAKLVDIAKQIRAYHETWCVVSD